ncbi:alpha/beta hydrolase [Rhodoferax sp. GW822-FHT02A01]|uniref:alpha/beta fold hydrolase n=1 Tax=Rhodoferax sp. GW822-FHT02A01 TaxID=3141537 RepID=UPI00315DFF90
MIHAEVGGSGPPLLLLHGYPQTHVAWHRIVPALAKHFTVIAPDLRGYGDSVGPSGDAQHTQYSKRTMALDNLALMQSLGFSRFAVMGHDRGARVGYRMCLDAPQAVNCFTSLTVVPTAEMWSRANMAFGMKAFHWYLFAQPFDLPERLLRSDPSYFLDWTLRNMVVEESAIHSECRAEYHRAFARESVRHAMMEEYRAAASIDLEHDKVDLANGHKVACPVQILWNKSATASPTPEEIWRTWADQVEGATIDCGHLMAEEAPDEVLQHALPFLTRHSAP